MNVCLPRLWKQFFPRMNLEMGEWIFLLIRTLLTHYLFTWKFSYWYDNFSSLFSLYPLFIVFGLSFINRNIVLKIMKNFHLNIETLELKLCISYFDSQYLKICANFHSVKGGESGSNTFYMFNKVRWYYMRNILQYFKIVK